MARKMIWRNERALYRRKSDFSGEEIISQYSPESSFPVYGVQEFYERSWEIPSMEYDPLRSFFDQFQKLIAKTPRCALLTDLRSSGSGSMYQNAASRNKDCYMVFASGDNEKCLYGSNVDYCRNSLDGLWVRDVHYSYECIDCVRANQLFFSQDCDDCVESHFLFNCSNCTSCFGCVNLRNKSYCLWNKQLSRGEYNRRVQEILTGLSRQKISEFVKKIKDLALQFPRKYAHIDNQSSNSVLGDYIYNSRNVSRGFFIFESENIRNCSKIVRGKDCVDMTDWGDPAELCYESITVGKGAFLVFFSNNCWPSCRELEYCDSCSSSQHLFGCVGLKNASFRILNKQYSEEEYYALKEKIVYDMKFRGEYGEFFPSELSPFAYNETIAQEYFPLTKEEVLSRGYSWRDPGPKQYEITISAKNLSDNIKDVQDSILKETIGCSHQGTCTHQCTSAFKIIPQELEFYRKMNLPLPRLCPNCRHYERLAKRNPLKLWHRKCHCAGEKSDNGRYQNQAQHFHGGGHCPNEFETSYAPERPEIVYCEQCYQNEVV